MSTPKPVPPRLVEVKDTAEVTGSFLTAEELGRVSQASKDTCLIFSQQLAEKALLKAVFDADPKRVQEILQKPRPPKSKCIILTKTHCRETYFSPSLNKTGCKRVWSNISPLEAAAWCGDIFLVRDLLLHISPHQKSEACKQLKGILERKESEENGIYLAPFRALIQAYHEFDAIFINVNHDELTGSIYIHWHQVWQRQRLLPTYGLQEFCDDKIFHPPHPFEEAPKRSCYLYNNNPDRPLDLDEMELESALYKGSNHGAWPRHGMRWNHDSKAMIPFCEVRTNDLINIIKELEGPTPLEESDDTPEDEISVPPTKKQRYN